MISDVQREVAIHLLANAIRKRRSTVVAGDQALQSSAGLPVRGRTKPDDEYLRGMIDLLSALFGRAVADDLYREAIMLERS